MMPQRSRAWNLGDMKAARVATQLMATVVGLALCTRQIQSDGVVAIYDYLLCVIPYRRKPSCYMYNG